jgi:glycosyltransferase involved in cell wall biosynthesis
MDVTRPDKAFTGDDQVSKYLLDLTADRAQHIWGTVPAGLLELSQHHGLVPLLAEREDDLMVRAIMNRETVRRRVLEGHLSQILDRLCDSGIKVAVVKGPAVAARYRNPADRPFSDLDLLVPENQLESALNVLREYPATVRVPGKRPKADKRDVLVRDETGIRFNVDLHWDLFSYRQLRGSSEGATDAAWAEARDQPDSDMGPVWEVPDSYGIAFLCAHSVLDHRFRLILFRDLLELSRGGVDWDSLGDVAARFGLQSTTYVALWIGRMALGVSVPEDFLSMLRPSSLPVRYLEHALPRVDLARFDGHHPHSVNLAAVLLNDSAWQRLTLTLRAPTAFLGWRRRVSAPESLRHPPRTLIVVSTDRRRGAEVFSELLRDGLAQRGWVVEAVALRGSGSGSRAAVETLTDPVISEVGRFDWALVRALRRKIRAYRPDLIVANGGSTLRYSLTARLGLGIDLAYIGIGEPEFWIRSRLSRWMNRAMLRMTDHVLAVSETTRIQLIALEPDVAAKSHTVFTGIDPGMTDIPLGDPTGPLKVILLGSLSPEKDPSLALRAVSALPNALLRFVGSGPLAASLERQSDERGMSGRVEFVGSVEDVRPHLEWAHVLILTSRTEGLPGAILEASAAGRPVVAVDVGGVREAVIDGQTGFVTGRDVDELIDRLRQLDEDRDLLSKMGAQGRRHIYENFMIDDIIERYRSALEPRPK